MGQSVTVAAPAAEDDVLRRPPRESIFNRLMVERMLVAAVVMAGMGDALFV